MQADEFDYVIVGAGSAGCVLADRLTRDGRHRVLLLESGGSDARLWIKVPIGYAFNVGNPALNWGYRTQPDAELDGRVTPWPRGRVIGGSGSINAMAYVRGLPCDFDDWAAAGATGWGWDTVRSVYDRMETRHAPDATGRRTAQGSGPVWVSDLSEQMNPFSRTFLEAARDIDLPLSDDMNAEAGEGVTYYRSNVRRGRRWSSADAFLRTAKGRPNLKVITGAEAQRIERLNGQGNLLYYRHGGRDRTVRARREILVSAGAINTPKLLQLSGIGPAALLRSRGVPVVRDLPQVGCGLQDHLAVSYQFHATRPTLNAALGSMTGRLRAGLDYVLRRRGPLAVPVNQVGGFVRSAPDRAGPDVQLFCNPASYEMSPAGRPVLDREQGYLISAQPCRPTSRGAVRIASPDPGDAPLIEANSLATEGDRDAALRASRLLQRLAMAPSLRAVTRAAKLPDLTCLDDDGLMAAFRARASTVYHASCTCRMGHGPEDSVLDARLQVHGVPGLRVVDASAFPNVTSGNTNAPTMMLAMRAADLILQDAG
ncbi:GMC family oxidoreductase [Roseovarius sp. D22-M7]|uniref:GMC family oxidoreductase n=1 Tax=Roseovarius sp. D22-M7 TaxID=3127116 RepID=UPI00300FAB4F